MARQFDVPGLKALGLSPGDFAPQLSPYSTILYVQFNVNIHDDSDVAAFLILTDESKNPVSGPCVLFVRSGTALQFSTNNAPGSLNLVSADNAFTLNEWHVVELALSVIGRNLCIAGLAIDGNGIYDVNIVNKHVVILKPGGLAVGGIANGGPTVNHNISDIKIGTRGFGSDDIFSFVHGDALSKFDSVTGDGISIDTDGSILVSNDGSQDVYALKSITFP